MRVALVGTYPPRKCGIATFTSDLREGLGQGHVIALDRPEDGLNYAPEVILKLRPAVAGDYRRAAELLNAQADVVSLQHEYGIFGGPDGELVVELLAHTQVPVVTTLHTVGAHPTAHQREVLKSVAEASARVVVMTQRAKEIAARTLGIGSDHIEVIAHGVPDLPFGGADVAKRRLGLDGQKLILTFGLLGPNKRIELVLEAMALVVHKCRNAIYAVVGATHPDLLRDQGETYRNALLTRTGELGLDRQVRFVDRYLSSDELSIWLRAADVFVTPYGDAEQASSGTLAYALAAGKAIISTPYEHAVELLAEGRGLLVPFNDVTALAGRLRLLLTDERLRAELGRRAYDLGHRMTWKSVAAQYRQLSREVAAPAERLLGLASAVG